MLQIKYVLPKLCQLPQYWYGSRDPTTRVIVKQTFQLAFISKWISGSVVLVKLSNAMAIQIDTKMNLEMTAKVAN